MAFLRFSKFALLLVVLTSALVLRAQVVVRAGTVGKTWTAGMACTLNTTFAVATPDNLHVFKAINFSPGTAAGTQPLWNTLPGAVTTDGTCTWKEAGTAGLGGVDPSANYIFTGT